MRLLSTACLLVVLLIPAVIPAQGPPPPPEEGKGMRPPGPPMDALFYRGMALLALDEKAGLLKDAGRTDAAIVELGKVYDYDIPKDHPAYEIKVRLLGELATLYVESGKRAEAVKTIEGMLAEVEPGTPAEAAAWFEAGKTYRAAGMTDNALEAFDRAIALSDALAKSAPERGPRPGGDPHGRGPGGPPLGSFPQPPPPVGEPQ